jgi:hypothetical protein
MSGESFHYRITDSLKAGVYSISWQKAALIFAAEPAAGVLNVIKR